MATRQIVLDTETTGLNARLGDRIIEIGCIEIVSRRVTDRHYHAYLDPERDIEEGAAKVHGLTREFLADSLTPLAVYRRLGWEARPVSARAAFPYHGTLGCLVNVLQRQ